MSGDTRKLTKDLQDRITDLAFMMWERAGRQQGMASEYWLAAEREVMAAAAAAADKLKPSTPTEAESKPGEVLLGNEASPSYKPAAKVAAKPAAKVAASGAVPRRAALNRRVPGRKWTVKEIPSEFQAAVYLQSGPEESIDQLRAATKNLVNYLGYDVN